MTSRQDGSSAERPERSRPSGGEAGPDLLRRGDRVTIVHAKPWKRTITMRGTVVSWDGTMLTLERQFSAGGQYDSLHVPKLAGDWGTIEVPRGGWILRRAYYRRDGALVGELFNIQQPATIDERGVRYVDLEVDVVRMPGGRVAIVDEDDLAEAVRIGGISRETADEAVRLAYRLADILREGGDWWSADADVREP
jgi:probable ribonuclease FAU-1